MKPNKRDDQDGQIMKFSIVTASYNQAVFLQRSLDSVAAQTYRNFEHLIHDGLSSDGSEDILKRHATKHPSVSLVIERDEGQVEAINNGLRRASGDILTWLNTDDFLFDQNVLAEVAKAFQDDSIDVVYGRGWYVDTAGKKIRDVYVNRHITSALDVVDKIGIFQPALFFRRRIFEKLGLLDKRYQLTLDYEYWIRLLTSCARLKFIDRPLAKATLHSDSKTCGLRTRQLAETALLLKQTFGYVHPSWINRLREHVVNNNDWTVIHQQPEESDACIDIPDISADSPLTQFNFGLTPRLGRGKTASRFGVAAAHLSRVIATSFNDKYFAQGLNLIASIHSHCSYSTDAIIIYDLGMTPAQLSILEQLRGVIIQSYPEDEPWENYFHSKSYIYKCYAIRDARRFLTNRDGTILWIDAGVCVAGPLDEIFDIIDESGVFLINHDDRHSKSLVNAAFTHPNQVIGLSLSPWDLDRDHVCSCAVGYRISSVGERLIECAYELSLKKELNDYTKHPSQKWHNHLLFDGEYEARLSLVNNDGDQYAPIAALARYPYYGHRQDQSLYSNLAAIMDCDVSSASRYCPATDYSSTVSFENWKSGGEYSDIQRSLVLPEGFSAPLYHHRGTYTNLCGLKIDTDNLVFGDVAMILGNGPSLKEIPFTKLKGVVTIGMNAAYRYWDVVGWYPTYYCCMDTVVINSHAKEIKRLIDGSKTYGIKLFFLRRAILEKHPELELARGVIFLEDVRPLCSLFQVEPITTGSYSLLFLAFLGFREIYIAGVDCNYVERLTGTVDGDTKNKLIVKNPIKTNPNYFFDSYQQQGDEFNLPNPSESLHIRAWRNANTAIHERKSELGQITIFNLNRESRVDCFVNKSWGDALHNIYKHVNTVGRALIRDLSMSPEVRRLATDELTNAIYSVVSGSRNSHFASAMIPTPRCVDIKLKKIIIHGGCVEFRLDSPLEMYEHEVLGATFVLFGLVFPLKVTLLNINDWAASPFLNITNWRNTKRALHNKPQALYLNMLDEDTGLLLVNGKVKSRTKFIGIKFDTPDAESIEHVKTLKCIGVSIFKPTVTEKYSNSEPAATMPISATQLVARSPGKLSVASSKMESFSEALSFFRQGKYSDSLRIATQLAQRHPDFKWYGMLVEASRRKLSRNSLRSAF